MTDHADSFVLALLLSSELTGEFEPTDGLPGATGPEVVQAAAEQGATQ